MSWKCQYIIRAGKDRPQEPVRTYVATGPRQAASLAVRAAAFTTHATITSPYWVDGSEVIVEHDVSVDEIEATIAQHDAYACKPLEYCPERPAYEGQHRCGR